MLRLKNFLSASKVAGIAAIVFLATTIAGPLTAMVHAAPTNPTPKAKISFTFDDGLTSTLTQAAPTLKKYGYSGTVYVTTDCVGMTTKPNTCKADGDTTYMTWTQIKMLRSLYGWEIGSHTASHSLLATSDPDFQPNPLTPAQVTQELVKSRDALAAQGIPAPSFAPPYGDYNMATLAEIAKYYETMRGFQDTGYNTWPNNEYLIRDQDISGQVSVATVKGYIDQAIKNNQWLVLTFHDIKQNPSTDPAEYEYSTRNLDAIAAYVKSKNVQVVNVRDGIVRGDTNLMPNASFNSGIASGWRTDSPATITADAGNNGSYPDPAKSVKLVSSATNGHLFSPQVAVDANTTYVLKNFLNVQKLMSGGVSFYIDEYDSLGNWVSGQYKGSENGVFVENMNFTYKPSSASVKKASLQIIVTANSGITAYVDNIQWFPVSSVTPPVQQNLVANGTFDAGISGGWTTNNATAFKADAANHGSPANPVNAVAMAAQAGNAHLFSPLVTVAPGKTYNLTSYVNVVTRTSGELGFYIDEYDVNGNWISGQYKGGVAATGASDVSLSYTPSSASVAKASLQFILVGNSGVTGYIDHVRWY